MPSVSSCLSNPHWDVERSREPSERRQFRQFLISRDLIIQLVVTFWEQGTSWKQNPCANSCLSIDRRVAFVLGTRFFSSYVDCSLEHTKQSFSPMTNCGPISFVEELDYRTQETAIGFLTACFGSEAAPIPLLRRLRLQTEVENMSHDAGASIESIQSNNSNLP